MMSTAELAKLERVKLRQAWSSESGAFTPWLAQADNLAILSEWGSCNPETGSIRLNSEVAKKPVERLEYLVVHEMAHLGGRTHNRHFADIMDRFMPRWQYRRDMLNRLPV